MEVNKTLIEILLPATATATPSRSVKITLQLRLRPSMIYCTGGTGSPVPTPS